MWSKSSVSQDFPFADDRTQLLYKFIDEFFLKSKVPVKMGTTIYNNWFIWEEMSCWVALAINTFFSVLQRVKLC